MPRKRLGNPRFNYKLTSDQLTDSEKHVALLIHQGLTSSEIAKELGLSVGTIDRYRTNITEKTGLKGSVAVALAVERGEIG